MIIIAILALLVLVILAFVFGSKINLFGKGVSNCAGECKSPNGQTPSQVCDYTESGKVYTYNSAGTCSIKTDVCCMVAYTQ